MNAVVLNRLYQIDENAPPTSLVDFLRADGPLSEVEPRKIMRVAGEVFIEQVGSLLLFLKGQELIDAQLHTRIQKIVESDPKNDIVELAQRVQHLLFREIAVGKLAAGKCEKIMHHLPPCFLHFPLRLQVVADLHACGKVSDKEYVAQMSYAQALKGLSFDPLFLYELLKTLPVSIWEKLPCPQFHIGDLSLVEAFAKDAHVLEVFQEDEGFYRGESGQLLARQIAEQLCNRQDYIKACGISLKVADNKFQERVCGCSIKALLKNGRSQDCVTIIHNIGQRPVLEKAVGFLLSTANPADSPMVPQQGSAINNSLPVGENASAKTATAAEIAFNQEIKWTALLLEILSPKDRSASTPELLDRAVISWAEKQGTSRQQRVQQCLQRLQLLRRPLVKDESLWMPVLVIALAIVAFLCQEKRPIAEEVCVAPFP
jgi:hypothetical protein